MLVFPRIITEAGEFREFVDAFVDDLPAVERIATHGLALEQGFRVPVSEDGDQELAMRAVRYTEFAGKMEHYVELITPDTPEDNLRLKADIDDRIYAYRSFPVIKPVARQQILKDYNRINEAMVASERAMRNEHITRGITKLIFGKLDGDTGSRT